MTTTGLPPSAPAAGMSTQPAPPPAPASGWGWLRWGWRQLTSMRTALVLLFLLAVAAIPGSVFPQTAQDPGAVAQYIASHGAAGRLLERLGVFDTFGAPWFAAIYLLLFTSLLGCVLPRARLHFRAARARPPRAPARLDRLPSHVRLATTATPEQALAAAAAVLRARRFRVDTAASSVAAEKGYARETGNLVFHVALIGLLVAVAVGAGLGTKGQVLVVQGAGFSDQVTQFDSFTPGRFANVNGLAPFAFTLTRFSATYSPSGEPLTFAAALALRERPGMPVRPVSVTVNHPLDIDGTKVFLVGHGYAPVVSVRDGRGHLVFSAAVPFLPQDGMFTSSGVIKVPDARPTQLGFQGVFTPTASISATLGPRSTYPGLSDPALFVSVYTGNLGLDTGEPQSVYILDTSRMKGPLAITALRPGQTWTLPHHAGTLTFTGVTQWASFQVNHDPGTGVAFVSATLAVLGLMGSLFVRRRRIWVRATAQPDGPTLLEVAGLARSEATSVDEEVAAVADRLAAGLPPPPPVASDEEEHA